MGEILSGLEWEVLSLYLQGKSYQEIAEELDRHVKSIDNALQRVKRKLESIWKKVETSKKENFAFKELENHCHTRLYAKMC
jgi:predicted DNA-binding protein YlxM (UPF0122 family)